MVNWSPRAMTPGRSFPALPRDLDRLRAVSSIAASPDMDGLTRGLILGVPVSALLWLLTGLVVAKLIG